MKIQAVLCFTFEALFNSVFVLLIIGSTIVFPFLRRKRFETFKKTVLDLQKYYYIKKVFESCVNVIQIEATFKWAKEINQKQRLNFESLIIDCYIESLNKIVNV